MSYTAATIPALDVTTPTASTATIDEINDAIREIKTVLKYQFTPVAITNGDSPYTAVTTSSIILANATSGAITINLPTAASIAGRTYVIKKTDSSTNAITVDGYSSETIDGETTLTIANPNEVYVIVSNGTNWVIEGQYNISRVFNKTANYTILDHEADGLTTFSNDGDSGNIEFTLPSANANRKISFICAESDYLFTITAASEDSIRIGGNQNDITDSVYGYNAGDSVELVAINATEWIALNEGSQAFKPAGMGYLCGSNIGGTPFKDVIKINFGTEAGAWSGSFLDSSSFAHSGVQSSTNGYLLGGNDGLTRDEIQKLIFNTEVFSTIEETLVTAQDGGCSAQNSSNGYLFGGSYLFYSNIIAKFILSSETASELGVVLATGRVWATGLSSPTVGYVLGGYGSGGRLDSVEKFTFSSETVGAVSATLDDAKSWGNGVYHSTKGFYCGGYRESTGATNEIEEFTYSGESLSVSSETLSTTKFRQGAAQSHFRGYIYEGYDTMDALDFNNDTCAATSTTVNTNQINSTGLSHNI